MPREGPIRVLSIVTGTHLGGVGLWMLDVLRHIDRDRFRVDVMAIGRGSVADYEERVRALGSRLIHCPYHSRRLGPLSTVGFALRFGRVLRDFGPYDAVHDCVTLGGGGAVPWVSVRNGISVRVLHAHSGTDRGLSRGRVKRLVAWPVVARTTTHFLGVSSDTAMGAFHRDITHDSRFGLSTGMDISAFEPGLSVELVRDSLGLDRRTKIVGHVGRFSEEKRHDFWVRVAVEVAKKREDAAFLLVGEGPLRPQIESQAEQAGIADRCHFLGLRTDVADLMRGAMDLLLFPSRFEGLPRVVVEAQCAGLPCVISDSITAEVDIIPALIQRHSLADPPEAWAETVIRALDRQPPVSQAEAFALVAQSPYNIAVSVRALEGIYETARQRARRGATASTGHAGGAESSEPPV